MHGSITKSASCMLGRGVSSNGWQHYLSRAHRLDKSYWPSVIARMLLFEVFGAVPMIGFNLAGYGATSVEDKMIMDTKKGALVSGPPIFRPQNILHSSPM
ncbi:hypothetical protein [Novosphingobium sp. AP12]|uniref:hypothetical protein n=1 Tax=Novosphingobium sp. AP12 TaxID=1144305 RepID=UPI0012F7A5BA|nr:hypothetical protein [Novosphingobium sp. AP12]